MRAIMTDSNILGRVRFLVAITLEMVSKPVGQDSNPVRIRTGLESCPSCETASQRIHHRLNGSTGAPMSSTPASLSWDVSG